jgi:hypothetical protein
MEINWLRAVGAGFDLALTISVCAFIGYYLGGGRLNQVTPLSILGLVIGALFGLFIAIYSLIRMFGATGGGKR